MRVGAVRSAAVLAAAGALLAGGLTGAGAQPAQAASVSMPPWLMPLMSTDDTTGATRECDAIRLGPWRALATPDCFLGRSKGHDTLFVYGSDGHISGGWSPAYFRNHPQYDWRTRRADLSYTEINSVGSGAPVLAGPADTALYRPGAAATFYSWANPSTDPYGKRVPHSEQVAVMSAAQCAQALGQAPPPGGFCTRPAPGAPAVPAASQCLGDAGGALLAGGKLIGLSATVSTHCVRDGVRLYTDMAAYRGQVTAWARDVDYDELAYGSVLARVATASDDPQIWTPCSTDVDGKLDGCYPSDWGGPSGPPGLFDFLIQAGDLNGDGEGDIIARAPGGALYLLPHVRQEPFLDKTPKVRIGKGWNAYDTIMVARDLSGDGIPDVIARDRSGNLWMNHGTASGLLAPRVRLGTGWNGYNLITVRGDLSGDGLTDIVARDRSGVLWLYKGNGKGGYAARVRMGTGYGGYRFIVSSGDFDHDGRPDLVGVTTSGSVYLHNADGKGGLLARELLAVNRWKGYSGIS